METPYAVVNSNGTCPDTFLITIDCGQYADLGGLHLIRHRGEGQTDTEFWDWVMDEVASLLTQFTGTPHQHAVTITCMYQLSNFTPTPSYPIEVFAK